MLQQQHKKKLIQFDKIKENINNYNSFYNEKEDLNIKTETETETEFPLLIEEFATFQSIISEIYKNINIELHQNKQYNNTGYDNNYNNNKNNNKNNYYKKTKNNYGNEFNNSINSIKNNNFNKIDTKKDNGGSILRSRLLGKNKDLLKINCEINKLTESNIDIIFDTIYTIINDTTKNIIEPDKFNYIFDNIIEKCISQPPFTILYIKFLTKFNKFKYIKTSMEHKIKTTIQYITNYIELIEIHDSKMDTLLIKQKTENNIFTKMIKENKQFEGIGSIYGLFYINKFINKDIFIKFITKTIQQVNDYIEWEPCTNDILEKYINVLIGLLEYGYYTLIKNVDYETKLTLQMKIEHILSSKKIELRIKYNLQNLYDDLKAGKRK
jgi:hypothetical protein